MSRLLRVLTGRRRHDDRVVGAGSDGVVTKHRIQVGRGTDLATRVGLLVEGGVVFGKRCSIVADGRIGTGSVLSNGVRITGDGTVELEGDNWVGTGATLVAPVTLHRGAVVAPGTVVTGVVPAMAIAAGDPGKVIGSRFSNDVIREHEGARLPVGS